MGKAQLVGTSVQRTVWILGTHGVPAAYGGFETAAEHIGRGLLDRGWRVVVYCQNVGRGATTTDTWRGLERVHIREARAGWLGTASFDLASIRHVIRNASPDDVCLTFGYNTGVFNCAQRLRHLPNVINMDGMEWTRRRWGIMKQGILLANERFAGFVGDVLIADHPEIAIYLRAHFGSTRVDTIAYGAEACHEAGVDSLAPLGLTPGRFATVICRPIPENSVLEIVQAWSHRPREHQLVVLGDFDPRDSYHAEVLAAASAEVCFPGAIYEPDVVRALRFHSSLYLHGHTVGGTNPSLVEAMAAHNAVIAHDNRYNTWVAGPENAYFRGVADLDARITDLLANPEARARMGAASFERYAAEFTWERITDQYENALLRAVARSAARRSTGGGSRIARTAGHLQPSLARAATEGAPPRDMPGEETETAMSGMVMSQPERLNVAVVGLGKMGLSHAAMIRPHPAVNLVATCDESPFVRALMGRVSEVPVFANVEQMLDETRPQAVVVATPSTHHASVVRTALERGIDVFCEKPLCLDVSDSRELADLASERALVTSVGYHNRFVATFAEVKRLVDVGLIGRVTNVLAEAYGPVILKQSSGGWRSRRDAGGGCLFDYAAHPVDLLTWYLGEVNEARGSRLDSIFSAATDDAVSSTLRFAGTTAQLSVNWSDESQRKMTTKMTLWGTNGRIYADRQEIQVYLRDGAPRAEGYRPGWNVKYTTELTKAPYYYLRGEEYSAQLDDFVQRCRARELDGRNTFRTGSVTDDALAMIVADARRHDGEGSTEPFRASVRSRMPRWRVAPTRGPEVRSMVPTPVPSGPRGRCAGEA